MRQGATRRTEPACNDTSPSQCSQAPEHYGLGHVKRIAQLGRGDGSISSKKRDEFGFFERLEDGRHLSTHGKPVAIVYWVKARAS